MKKINPKYQLHRISDLPWNAKTVRIERVEGARRSAQEVLLLHEGKVYTLSWRAGDVRSSPSVLPAFRRLTGMKDRELRQARKDYLAEAEADRNSERTRELERRASRLGYKLVVA